MKAQLIDFAIEQAKRLPRYVTKNQDRKVLKSTITLNQMLQASEREKTHAKKAA